MSDQSPQLDFTNPDVELIGELTEERAAAVIEALRKARDDDRPLVVSVTTAGGDAELARRICLEITERRKSGRRLVFVGKTQCYSAGVSIMSAFPVADRFLSEDCWLLIHCRQLEQAAEISGPIRGSLPKIEAIAAQIRMGIELEDETFRRLIAESDISFEEICSKAPSNWYLSAKDALQRRLVAGIIGDETL